MTRVLVVGRENSVLGFGTSYDHETTMGHQNCKIKFRKYFRIFYKMKKKDGNGGELPLLKEFVLFFPILSWYSFCDKVLESLDQEKVKGFRCVCLFPILFQHDK